MDWETETAQKAAWSEYGRRHYKRIILWSRIKRNAPILILLVVVTLLAIGIQQLVTRAPTNLSWWWVTVPSAGLLAYLLPKIHNPYQQLTSTLSATVSMLIVAVTIWLTI